MCKWKKTVVVVEGGDNPNSTTAVVVFKHTFSLHCINMPSQSQAQKIYIAVDSETLNLLDIGLWNTDCGVQNIS